MINLDRTDYKLIKLLEQDARQSSEKLAQQLNLSSPTVRRRINRLIANGIINILAVVDPYKTGQSLSTIIALEIDYSKLDHIIQELTKISSIQWFSITTGRFAIIIQARFASNDELADFMVKKLTKIKGIRNSETFMCLKQYRLRYFYGFPNQP